jgi:hypothetical protein
MRRITGPYILPPRCPEPVREITERYGVPRFERFSEVFDRSHAVAFAVPPPVQAQLAVDAAGARPTPRRPLAGDTAGAAQPGAAGLVAVGVSSARS